jgi:hypothetical protein
MARATRAPRPGESAPLVGSLRAIRVLDRFESDRIALRPEHLRKIEGDGAVPLISALCPDGVVSLGRGSCCSSPNIHHNLFRGVVHQDRFVDWNVQDLCFNLPGIAPPARETEGELVEEMEFAKIESELEMELSQGF